MTHATIGMQSVGTVRSPRSEATDDHRGGVESIIALNSRFGPDALLRLGQYSHLEILFLMHRVDP